MVGRVHLGSPRFGLTAAALDLERVLGRPVRGAHEPRRQHGLRSQRRRFTGQQEEHRLNHVLRHLRIAHLPPGGRVHCVDVPRHNPPERRLRAVVGVFPQQLRIHSSLPLLYYGRSRTESARKSARQAGNRIRGERREDPHPNPLPEYRARGKRHRGAREPRVRTPAALQRASSSRGLDSWAAATKALVPWHSRSPAIAADSMSARALTRVVPVGAGQQIGLPADRCQWCAPTPRLRPPSPPVPADTAACRAADGVSRLASDAIASAAPSLVSPSAVPFSVWRVCPFMRRYPVRARSPTSATAAPIANAVVAAGAAQRKRARHGAGRRRGAGERKRSGKRTRCRS